MKQKTVVRNIRLYAWFQIFREPLFWGPILITYITNIGKMELSEVYFMEAVVVFAMVFMEIYSSAWADLLGRKKIMLLGSFLTLISVVLFALVSSPVLVWISNITISIGFALVSGVDEAFLVDMMKEAGIYDCYTKVNGKILSWKYILVAVSCIVSGYLYVINPRLPIILSIPPIIVSISVIAFMTEPRRLKKATKQEYFDLMKMSILFVANHKKIKWIIAYMTLLIVSSKLWFFTYNPYFELVDISPEYYGWIFFTLNMVCWVTSKYAYKIEKGMSEFRIIVLTILIAGLPTIFMGSFIAKVIIVFMLFENLNRGFKTPFFSNFINEHLDSKNRATVLSIKKTTIAVIQGVSLLFFGLLLKITDLGTSLQILGIVTLMLGAYLISRYKALFQ